MMTSEQMSAALKRGSEMLRSFGVRSAISDEAYCKCGTPASRHHIAPDDDSTIGLYCDDGGKFSPASPPAPSASQRQVGGNHYASKSIQPWDAMQAWMTPEEFRGYLRGNVIKYAARCNDKGGVEDLRKAQHYLEKLIEVVK